MATYELLLPKMGESIAEATIIKWMKNPGDEIRADEVILEIATDKVDSEVPSPVTGKLIKQLFKEDEVVHVGTVIAIIETQQEAVTPTIKTPDIVASKENMEADEVEVPYIKQAITSPEKQQTNDHSRFYSPLVKNIASQEGLGFDELDEIPGTGAEGRLTKDDLLEYIRNRPEQVAIQKAEQVITAETSDLKNDLSNEIRARSVTSVTPVSGEDEIVEMDRMRRLIADHMVMSKQTSPHVTSFVEADVTNLVQWRERVKQNFEKREGERITFTPIFIEAVAKAIKDLPGINISVNGTQIIKKKNINIGMATALPSGNLIVPVIHNADELNLIGLTKAVNDLAKRAKSNKLQPNEVKDGTFTITNLGSFGNLMGTPIINQPEVAILAVGVIKKKPAVIETDFGDMIAIRHMMFLSLSYDHRVVDGTLGGSFIRKVADYLEGWDLNREI
ncbi:MAG: dihydrolipoamide acetyltransferase family protein [Sphingobacteriaceae bacterium]